MINIIRQESLSGSAGVSTTVYKMEKTQCAIDRTTFLAETLYKEVTSQDQLSGKNRKLKSLRKLQAGLTSILVTVMVASPVSAFAQTNTLNASVGQEITPSTVMEWGIQLALIVVAVGIAISGSLLAIAGVYRMLRKRKEAEEWTTDIIKGLVQVLIAIPVVYSLYYLSQIVFRSLPMLKGLM